MFGNGILLPKNRQSSVIMLCHNGLDLATITVRQITSNSWLTRLVVNKEKVAIISTQFIFGIRFVWAPGVFSELDLQDRTLGRMRLAGRLVHLLNLKRKRIRI